MVAKRELQRSRYKKTRPKERVFLFVEDSEKEINLYSQPSELSVKLPMLLAILLKSTPCARNACHK